MNDTERKYPSDYEPNGYASRNVGKSTAHAGAIVADLAAIILDDLTDGDDDNRRALRAAARLSQLGSHISEIGWNVYDGNFGEAKKAAKKLDAGEGGQS